MYRQYCTGSPVLTDLKTRIPATLELAFFGALIGIPIGLLLGIVAAVFRDRWADYGTRMLSIGILSVPSFWMGVVGIYLFFYVLRWVPPPIGRLPLELQPPPTVTGLLTVDSILAGNWTTFVGALRSLALPAVVLGLSLVAPVARMTRAALSEALQEDFITFARAIGVPEREVILRDALRGAMVAILTIIGYLLAHALGGAALVETVFAWPGVGRYAVQAVITSDMAPINAVLLIGAVSVALTNLLVDISHALVDPRIRSGVIEGS
jgi:ABC-type dipeptide/oligopeptide/nickel transport system permease component